jgi:hypothetical protein
MLAVGAFRVVRLRQYTLTHSRVSKKHCSASQRPKDEKQSGHGVGGHQQRHTTRTRMHEPVAGWKQSVMTASKPQVLANEVQQEGNWRPPQRDMHPHGFIVWGPLCAAFRRRSWGQSARLDGGCRNRRLAWPGVEWRALN